jgi:predicted nucleotidyltransferase
MSGKTETIQLNASLAIPRQAVASFCEKWQIEEFAVFGSAVRDDFRPDSDVDVLVTFNRAAKWDLFDVVEMKEELAAIFGRDVDLVDREALEGSRNPFRRREVLRNARLVHVDA